MSNSEYSDQTISINYSDVSSLCSSWGSSVSGLNLNGSDVTNAFQALTSEGILSSTVSSVVSKLDSITSSITSLISSISASSSAQQSADDYTNGGYTPTTGGGSNGGNNGGNSHSDDDKDNDKDKSKDEQGKVSKKFANAIDSLDSYNYSSFMNVIYSFCNDELSLNTILADYNNCDLVKMTLLKSSYVPDDIKKMIDKMDAKDICATLLAYLGSGTVMDDYTKIAANCVISKYLNGKTDLKSMLKNDKNLVSIMNDFDKINDDLVKILLSDDINNTVADIIESNPLKYSDETVLFITKMVSSMDVNKLKDNSEMVKDSLTNAYKTFQYFEVLGGTDVDFVRQTFVDCFS